jgi:SAM-dependent methyltransferase
VSRRCLDDDDAFDACLPPGLARKARLHFTPVEVARQAAVMLAPRPGMVVLDVGAGVGKLCLVAALEVPDARFVGVELRPHLVAVANRLAAACALGNVTFVAGDALGLDWSAYDAFYFFNPFAEQLFDRGLNLDDKLVVDPIHYALYVDAVRTRLAAARRGSRLVTYHGYGGEPPAGYDLVREVGIGSDVLALWVKARGPA